MKYLSLVLFLAACGKEEDTTYQCTDAEILQECDADGENCTDKEDCDAAGLMCHAEMGHCMAMEEDSGEMGEM
tara:strand:- start:263 stop:481 length:219 start_codon:yes stop_codon:yes gene_type:complete